MSITIVRLQNHLSFLNLLSSQVYHQNILVEFEKLWCEKDGSRNSFG